MNKIHGDLAVLAVPIANLETLPGNPRRGDVQAIARSYDTFGQRKPVVATRTGERDGHPTGVVSGGNHQLAAARQLGWDMLAVVWTDDDSETQAAWALADNRTADLGTYDNDLLVDLLGQIDTPELFTATGYTAEDLEKLLTPPAFPTPEDDDPLPYVDNPRVQPGDVWQVGPHRIMCGDCRDADHVKQLLDGATINLAVTSPPYAQQRDYDESSGFKPIHPDDYVEWFGPVQENVAAHLADDGSWLVNIKPAADGPDTSMYVFDLVLAHARQWGWHFATEFCWERNGVPKQPVQRLKNQFEPVYQFAKGRWKFRPENVRHESDNVPISLGAGSGDTSWSGRQGMNGVIPAERRPRKNGVTTLMSDSQGHPVAHGEALTVGLAFPGNRLPTFVGSHEATGHAAAYPVGLPQFLTMLFTDDADTVYDPFLGSGSTLVAADNAQRIGYGMELSANYCDIAMTRLERATGLTATKAN